MFNSGSKKGDGVGWVLVIGLLILFGWGKQTLFVVLSILFVPTTIVIAVLFICILYQVYLGKE